MNTNFANQLYQQGMLASQQGQMDQAAEYFAKAAEQESVDSEFLMKVGQILEKIQKPAQAAKVYTRILNLETRHVGAYLGFGRNLMKLGNYKTAVQCFEVAKKLQPEEKTVHANLSSAYWKVGENEKGEKAIKEAYRLGIAPEFYYVHLASYYERSNKLDELGPLLEEGLSVCPDHHSLLVLLGTYYYRVGEYDKSLETLLKVVGKSDFNGLNLRLYFELGRVYDKIGKYPEAFDCYSKGNNFSIAEAQMRRQSITKGRKFKKNLEGMDFTGWNKISADTLDDPENKPIFVVGFPRSGTTLLNRILDSHKNLECVEEEPILYGVKNVVTSKHGSYFPAVKDFTKQQLNELRDQYLHDSKKYRKSGKGIHMVDKLPLMLVEIPFIKKLFPKSKIILALRHPCDCTLSCFMQNFDLNQAMLNLTNLDDVTSYYVDIMSQWVFLHKELKFDYYPFYYEKLVQNKETEIRKLVEYLELEWDPGIMDFTEKAAALGTISTPSYHQVVRPIYADSKERWHNYRSELEPYLDRLKPFCDEFGYKL